jgi:ketosteroid isomerase-like protein
MTNESPSGDQEILIAAYRGFNARQIDAVLALMHPDVVWPNGMEGGYVNGHDGIRAYWTRQWAMIDSHVDPIKIEKDSNGRLVVEVHQVVRDLEGNVILNTIVHHAYILRAGLIERMDIE